MLDHLEAGDSLEVFVDFPMVSRERAQRFLELAGHGQPTVNRWFSKG